MFSRYFACARQPLPFSCLTPNSYSNSAPRLRNKSNRHAGLIRSSSGLVVKVIWLSRLSDLYNRIAQASPEASSPMFEKYTQRARRVIFFSRYEASLLGHRAIEPEHILLGILREDLELFRRLMPDRSDLITDVAT